jgi:hypothetical protein
VDSNRQSKNIKGPQNTSRGTPTNQVAQEAKTTQTRIKTIADTAKSPDKQ